MPWNILEGIDTAFTVFGPVKEKKNEGIVYKLFQCLQLMTV